MSREDFRGKTALVTGGAVRLGASICRALGETGFTIILHYNTSEREAFALRDECEAMGIRCGLAPMDFGNPEGCEYFFNEVVGKFGPVDLLVNSACPYPEDCLFSLKPETALKTFAVGTLSPLMMSRAFAAQKRKGLIVNILDARLNDYDRGHLSYSLAKQALYRLTRIMSLEFAPEVRVNAIAPGFIDFSAKDGPIRAARDAAVLGVLPGAADVVSCLLFLLENEIITGQVLYPDGGRNLKGNIYG